MRNKIILVGNLEKEPELRFTKKGNSTLTLTIGTRRNLPGGGNETAFHRAIVWGKLADHGAKYLCKGSRIYIEGDLHQKLDADGGRYCEITVGEMKFLGSVKQVANA